MLNTAEAAARDGVQVDCAATPLHKSAHSLSLFDTPIDRRGSDSIKWGKYAGRDVLPLWVADMDFAAPPAVVDALAGAHRTRRLRLRPPVADADGVRARSPRRRISAGPIEPEWIVWLPGLVSGLNLACRAVDGEVLTATPIYPPFPVGAALFGQNAEPC